MAEFRLSLKARNDLSDSYAYTERQFGRYQAEAYYAGLERTFGLLADFPGIGINSDEIILGYRRFCFQSHYIFCTQEKGHILIRADPYEAESSSRPF